MAVVVKLTHLRQNGHTMKAALFSTAIAAFASSAAFGQSTNCAGETVRYRVSLAQDGAFDVEGRFSRSQGQFDIHDVNDANGKGSASDFVKAAVEVTSDGDIPLTYEGNGTWKARSGAGPTTIRYRLHAGHDAYAWPMGKEEVAYRFDRAFYFVGSRFFLADFGLAKCSPEITFDLPADWSVAAPWPSSEPGVFRPADGEAMHLNGFAMGPGLQRFTSTFGAQGEVTYVYEKSLFGTAKLAAADMGSLANRYTKMFDGAAGNKFMIFMTSDAGNDGGAYRNSFAMRFKLPVRPADGMVWRSGFAHETLHLWIGHSIRTTDHNLEWFKEGFTDYVTAKALYAEGIFDGGEYERKIEALIGRYILALAVGGPKPLADAGRNKNQNRMMVYGGGAVVALLLDADMTATRGPGAFEAMLADLFARSAQPYDLKRLMSVLDGHSRGRASRILADVDAGLGPFAMADRLDPHGIALAVFAPEEMYVTFTGKGCTPGRNPCPPAFLRLP